MANIKISDLTSLTSATLTNHDLLPIVDVDTNNDGNTTDKTTKTITVGALRDSIFTSPTFTGDVTISSASNISSSKTPVFGQHLTNKNYVDTAISGISGGSSTLADLTDTTITSITNGEVIVYDSSSSKYVNKTLSEAGISPVGHSHIPTWSGDAKLADYTAVAVESGGALSIDPIQSQYPSATTPTGNPVDNADTTTDLAVDQAGNVVRTTQEATWTLTAAQINALTTNASGVELIEEPGANKFVIIEKATFLINYAYNGSSMSTAQQYHINQDGNVSDIIAVLNGTRINNITTTGQSAGAGNSDTCGIYEHDTGYSTLNRTYKPNKATTLRRLNTGAISTAVTSMTIKMRYRVYDVDTF